MLTVVLGKREGKKESGNVSKTCWYFGVSRESFYRWKRDDEQHSEQAWPDTPTSCSEPK